MKFTQAKVTYTGFENRHKFISLVINSSLHLFFFTVRKINKIIAYKDGNVIVISLHKLGDTIFTIPAIMELRRQYGKKLIILCFPETIPIYNLAFDDLNFCEIDHREFYFGQRIAKLKAKKKLNSLKPYKIFDLTGTITSTSLIYNIRAKIIIGINGKNFRAFYDHFVEIRKGPQLIDMYLDAISPIIKIQDRIEVEIRERSFNGNGRILLHPFAGWKEKEWNFKKFVELAEKLNKDYSVSIILPNDRIGFDIIQDLKNSAIDVFRTNSINELIQSIKECSVFIGNDSGPIHIANFIGKPTFTIYSSTNPAYTVPTIDHQIYIQNVIQCSARQNEQYCLIGAAIYHCPGIQCMNLLTVEQVYEKVLPLASEHCYKKSDVVPFKLRS